MKPRKLGSLLLWLLAAVVVTITFRMASTRTPNNHQPIRQAKYFSRMEHEPSAHLVETALRKADFPQELSATERAALRQPVLTPSGVTILPDHSLLVEDIAVVEDKNLTWDQCLNGGAGGGTPTGHWTFNELMLAVAGTTDSRPVPAEQMLMDLLYNFGNPMLKIGSFTDEFRGGAEQFFDNWPTDPNNQSECTNPYTGQANQPCLSLALSPVHLNAIVNRIDIGQNGQSDQAGMLRFVFGVSLSSSRTVSNGTLACPQDSHGQSADNQQFNIILEYNVPSTNIVTGQPITAQSWASAWQALSADCLPVFTSSCAQNTFDPALDNIVQLVVKKGAGGSNAPNGSALADLRTNETELADGGFTWELRQFQLGQPANPNELIQTALSQTPDLSFDFADNDCIFSNQDPNNNPPGCSTIQGEVENLVGGYQTYIENGTFTAPPAVQAASAINLTVYWDSSPSMGTNNPSFSLYTPRVIFAGSPQFQNSQTGAPDPQGGIDGTCNGCHGVETNTGFRQVFNRVSGTTNGDQPSALSPFLVGSSGSLQSPGCEVVQDPVYGPANPNHMPPFNNTFGDILRRVNCMNTILGSAAGSDVQCNGAGMLPQTNGTCP